MDGDRPRARGHAPGRPPSVRTVNVGPAVRGKSRPSSRGPSGAEYQLIRDANCVRPCRTRGQDPGFRSPGPFRHHHGPPISIGGNEPEKLMPDRPPETIRAGGAAPATATITVRRQRGSWDDRCRTVRPTGRCGPGRGHATVRHRVARKHSVDAGPSRQRRCLRFSSKPTWGAQGGPCLKRPPRPSRRSHPNQEEVTRLSEGRATRCASDVDLMVWAAREAHRLRRSGPRSDDGGVRVDTATEARNIASAGTGGAPVADTADFVTGWRPAVG